MSIQLDKLSSNTVKSSVSGEVRVLTSLSFTRLCICFGVRNIPELSCWFMGNFVSRYALWIKNTRFARDTYTAPAFCHLT